MGGKVSGRATGAVEVGVGDRVGPGGNVVTSGDAVGEGVGLGVGEGVGLGVGEGVGLGVGEGGSNSVILKLSVFT